MDFDVSVSGVGVRQSAKLSLTACCDCLFSLCLVVVRVGNVVSLRRASCCCNCYALAWPLSLRVIECAWRLTAIYLFEIST